MARKIIPHPFTKNNLVNIDEAMRKLRGSLNNDEFTKLPKAADAILRAHGYAPGEVGKKVQAVADRAFADRRNECQNQADYLKRMIRMKITDPIH